MGIFCLGAFWRTYNVLLVILVKQTIENPNPRDATLSSLSNFFTAKIQNGHRRDHRNSIFAYIFAKYGHRDLILMSRHMF